MKPAVNECVKCPRPCVVVCKNGHGLCGYHGKVGGKCPVCGEKLEKIK